MIPSEFEIERQSLIKELSELFGSVDFDGLSTSTIAVEHYAATKLLEILCAHGSEIFGATQVDINRGLFYCEETEYAIHVAEDVRATDELLFGIVSRDFDSSRHFKRDFMYYKTKIAGHGRYRRVGVFAPSTMPVDYEYLDYLIRTTLETIYSWMEEQIVLTVRANNTAMSDQLYCHARTLFLDRAVWNQLWFAAMADDRGFRLFDEFVATSTIDIVDKNAPLFGRGANDVVAEILKTNLPVEGLLMRHAIGRDDPIGVDISDAEYGKNHTSYSEAMRALYTSTSFSIFPILTSVDDRDKIVALYPTSLKSDVEPILHIHREALREIGRNSGNKIRATLAALRMKSRSQDLGLWAELAGRYTKGFLDF